MHTCSYPSFESLPSGYARLFEQQPRDDLFSSRIWIENNATYGIDSAEVLRLYGVEEGVDAETVPLALFVACTSRHYPAHKKALVVNFSSPEGALFSPVARRMNEPSVRRVLEQVVTEMRDSSEPHDVMRFGPLDPESDLHGKLVEILRRTGQILQFHHIYTNRYAVTAGFCFEDFLRSRSANFRKALARRQRRLEQSGRVRFELLTGSDGLESSISDCARILVTCWRDPDLDPMGYIASIIRAAAEAGALRLGMLYIDKQPVAYQVCVVSGGSAYFLRTAYDERFKRQSVGSAVIHKVIEHILDVDRVGEVDFGPGDQPYKKYWAPERRERVGIIAFNPRTVRGLQAIVRHVGGRTGKRCIERSRRILGKIGPRQLVSTQQASVSGP